MAKKNKEQGKMSSADISNMINNLAGTSVSFSLEDDDHPSKVKDWISTGSRVLDSTIAKGKMGGIPVGRITSFAGMPATGKSFIACQVAANAQKKGYHVIYFDTESSIDPDFLGSMGIDTKQGFTYVQPTHVEMIFETIGAILDSNAASTLFIWDSLAATQTKKELEDDSMNPQSSVGLRPRIISLGLKKIMTKLANTDSTLLVTNQLYTNIVTDPFDFAGRQEPYKTPGGNALKFAYSLEIWLTRRNAKSAIRLGEHGEMNGAEVKATLKKSRFGTERRECAFDIEWAGHVGVADKESWLDVVIGSSKCTRSGAWYTICDDKGKEFKFQTSKWMSMLEDPEFFAVVDKIMDYELIDKFVEHGMSNEFFNVEDKMNKVIQKIAGSDKKNQEEE